MHQASNMHNIIKIGAWAEAYVNFIYRETPPLGIQNLCNYIQQIQKYYKEFLLVKSLVGYQESDIPLMASDLRDIAK